MSIKSKAVCSLQFLCSAVKNQLTETLFSQQVPARSLHLVSYLVINKLRVVSVLSNVYIWLYISKQREAQSQILTFHLLHQKNKTAVVLTENSQFIEMIEFNVFLWCVLHSFQKLFPAQTNKYFNLMFTAYKIVSCFDTTQSGFAFSMQQDTDNSHSPRRLHQLFDFKYFNVVSSMHTWLHSPVCP